MAKTINQVFLTGRLGKDAELRYTPSGTAVTTFSLATERRVKKGDEWTSETDWHSVIAFKQEWAQNYLVKGAEVSLVGTIQYRSYDAKDGTKKYVTEILAHDIVPHGGKAQQHEAPADPKPVSMPRGGSAPSGPTKRSEGWEPSADDVPFLAAAPMDGSRV